MEDSWTTSYATMCRLCLQRDGFMLGIFNHIQGKEKSIHRKILDCTTLEISVGDGLPTCICHRCLFKIELCLEFKQQCMISDATLRQANGLAAASTNYTQKSSSYKTMNHHQMKSNENISSKTVPGQDFEKFSVEHQEIAASQVDNVVMVVDPLTLDYDSEYETDTERQSDVTENPGQDAPDFAEFRNVFMCKYCDRAYTNQTECAAHEAENHNTEIPYSCTDCEMGFADRANYTAHMKIVHQNDKPFGCPDCNRTFSRRSDLRKHTIVHTGVKPFTCHICFKSFSRNTNLSKHLRIHSGQKPFVCPKCPKTFISKGDLTRHAVIHSGKKPFACNFCEQTFGRRDKLIRHEKSHFVPELEPMVNIVQQQQQQQQERLHLNEQNVLEDEDSAQDYGTFPAKVKQELVDVEPDEEDMVINLDPYNHEGNYAATYNSLTSDEHQRELPRIPDHIENNDHHHQQHHQENNISNDNLSGHITGETHSGSGALNFMHKTKKLKTLNPVKRYPCLTCHKRFSRADALRTHQAVHSGDRPHVCLVCKKTFMRKRELDRHMSTHSGMKPFKCEHCDKRFGRKDKMLRHQKIHEVKQDQICVICGATFSRKDSLVHHMKTHNSADENINVYNTSSAVVTT